MNEKILNRTWTLGDYLIWEKDSPDAKPGGINPNGRWEFDGVRPRAMPETTQGRNMIRINLQAALKAMLRGGRCRAHGPNLMVITAVGTARFPDVVIDCGARDLLARHARTPSAVIEILSKETTAFEFIERFHEYDRTRDIRDYAVINLDRVQVVVWMRDGYGRLVRSAQHTSLGESFSLMTGVSVSLQTLYEGTGLA